MSKFFIEKNSGSSVDPSDPAWWVQIPEKGPYKKAITEINPNWAKGSMWLPLKQMVDDAIAYEGTSYEKKIAEKLEAEKQAKLDAEFLALRKV